jgi:DNA-3-methyladenine glycosylase
VAALVERARLTSPVLEVAPLLLGATIESRTAEGAVRVRITEVEAYAGADDPASHAYRGSTARTAVMFGPAGHLYCYFVYGMHWCANITCGPDGLAAAVLLRAAVVLAEPQSGVAAAAPRLASGPARLAKVLGLNGADSGRDLLDPASPVRLVNLDPPRDYQSGPRVGVSKAAERPWRFWVPGEPSVTRYRPGRRKRPDTTGHTSSGE